MARRQHRIPSDEYLSPAQTRVAVALCKGYDDKEVADKLCMSKYTVARHKQDIYERTGIRHTANALVAWFLAINFTIAIEDLERRIGAMVLAVVFSAFIAADNDIMLARRARRARRYRREYECVMDEDIC